MGAARTPAPRGRGKARRGTARTRRCRTPREGTPREGRTPREGGARRERATASNDPSRGGTDERGAPCTARARPTRTVRCLVWEPDPSSCRGEEQHISSMRYCIAFSPFLDTKYSLLLSF